MAELKFALPYLQSLDAPAAQFLSALLCLDCNGDKPGIEAKKAAFRHFETCISHAGFSQLSSSLRQEVLDRLNELKQLLSHSSGGLSRDKLGSAGNLQLLADCADAPPLHPSASTSMGLPVANPVPSQKRKAEDGHMSTSSKMPRLSSSQDTETDVVMVEGFAFRSSKRSY